MNDDLQIDLDKDFEYTGGNLLVCVNDKTGVDGNKCNFHTFVLLRNVGQLLLGGS